MSENDLPLKPEDLPGSIPPEMISDPSFLHNTEALEWEDVPLQVALLTMEVASLRKCLHDLMQWRAEVDERRGPPSETFVCANCGSKHPM